MALLSGGLPHVPHGLNRVQQGSAFHSMTLTGNLVLGKTYPNLLKLDPGGSARDVELDPVATSTGLTRRIINAADAAENLVFKNVGGDTIATANQNEQAELYCDGATWALVCITTIALS